MAENHCWGQASKESDGYHVGSLERVDHDITSALVDSEVFEATVELTIVMGGSEVHMRLGLAV
jgi:hypothetical protein